MSKSKPSVLSKQKRKLKSSVDGITKSVGLSPLRMLLALILLGGLGYLIYVVAFPGDQKGKAADGPSESRAEQLSLSADQVLNRLSSLTLTDLDNFLFVIEEMKDSEKKLDELEATVELTQKQKIEVAKIRTRDKGFIAMMLVRNNIEYAAEKAELIRYTKDHLDASDSSLLQTTHFWLCTVSLVEFTHSPSEETWQRFKEAVVNHSDGYLKTHQNAVVVSGMLLTMSKEGATKGKYAKQGFGVLSEQLVKSEVASIREMADKLETLAIYGDFDLQTLPTRIMWSDPNGVRDLENALDKLAQNPDSDVNTWVSLIRGYESFLATDKIEETGAAWKKVSDICDGLPDSEKKKTLREILRRQRARAMTVGTDFDVSGTILPDMTPFEPGENDFVVVFFSDKSANSVAGLKRLGEEYRDQQATYRPILAFEQGLTEKDLSSLHKIPKGISIASMETSRKFQRMIPVDFFPYILLIDRKGKVVAVNLHVDQIPNRIAKIQGDERRARNAQNTDSEAATLSP